MSNIWTKKRKERKEVQRMLESEQIREAQPVKLPEGVNEGVVFVPPPVGQ